MGYWNINKHGISVKIHGFPNIQDIQASDMLYVGGWYISSSVG